MSALCGMWKKPTINMKKIDNTLWASHKQGYSLRCQWHKSAAVGLCVTVTVAPSVVNHICCTAAGTTTWPQSTCESSSILSFSFHQGCRNPAPYLLEKADIQHSLLYTPLCLLACSSQAQCPLLRGTLFCARLLAALFLLPQEDAEDQEDAPPDLLQPWCWWVQLREGWLLYSSAALWRLHPRNIPCSSVANHHHFPDSHISLFINVSLLDVFRDL